MPATILPWACRSGTARPSLWRDGDGGLPSQPQPIAARIDLNRASRAELEALPPGIGEARAEAVIEARAVQPLASLEDLVQRGVWPSSVAERVRPYVGVAP